MSARRPWRSGWCGRTAAGWQHARCVGSNDAGTLCVCDCHVMTARAVEAANGNDPEARRRASAAVLLQALHVLEAATSAVTAELAIPPVRAAVDRLDDDQVRAVAVALAVEAVWHLPAADSELKYAGDVRRRLRQVRGWVSRLRLEASWAAS